MEWRGSLLLPIFVLFISTELEAQYTQIRSEIPPSLLECYRYPELLQREHLLPMTTNVLIALIRKIEKYQGSNLDARTTSLALLHKFRLDGIERQPNVEHTEHIIPYATKRPEFFRQKLLLEKFLPSRYEVLLESLNLVERCTLHWMLSNSVDPWERGDESFTCSRLNSNDYNQPGRFKRAAAAAAGDPAIQQGWDSQYSRDPSLPRDPSQYSRDPQFQRDPSFSRDPQFQRDPSFSRDSQYQRDYEGSLNQNRDPLDQSSPFGQGQQGQSFPRDPISGGISGSTFPQRNPGNYESPYNQPGLSSCPTDNGVLSSKYGAYKAGLVIAGIAAGLQPQNVSLGNILSSRESYSSNNNRGGLYQRGSSSVSYRSTQTYGLMIDNRWAATVGGEIALMVLLKTPSGFQSMRVGLSGGWNDTCVPKWYFLREPYHETITDTEVRGSVDGIILAYKMTDITRIDNTIKLSQILDMYYSEQGMFDSHVQAGNRGQLYASLVPSSYAQDQSYNFALSLNPELPASVAFADNSVISSSTQAAISSFNSYVASLGPRYSRDSYRNSPQPETAADLYVVLDFSWDFQDARRILTYLIDQFDVSPQSSKFYLINARDGNILVNATHSCLDFHLNFTEVAYRSQATGYDMYRTLQELRQHFRWRMELDRISNSGGGAPRVVLFMPHVTSVIYDKDRDDLWSVYEDFRRNLPDVHFVTTGQKDRSGLSLFDDYKDVFTLYLNDIRGSIEPIVNRINQFPRRIINPTCGANWYSQSWSVPRNTFFNYIGINSIQYFRLHPNYFFNSEIFRIKIQGFGYGMINVCYSRVNERPNGNSTSAYANDMVCRQINTDSHVIEIGEPCSDYDRAIQCPPLFISVATGRPTIQQTFRCNEDNCKNPAQIKFSFSSEGLTCHSGALKLQSSAMFFVALSILISFLPKSI